MTVSGKNMNDYIPDSSDDQFYSRSVRYSAGCILAVLLVMGAAIFLINADNSIMRADFRLFGANDISLPELSDMQHGAAGERISVKAESFTLNGNEVEIKLHGENLTKEEWKAGGSSFMLSCFNIKDAETRGHYYADNWEDITVPAGGSFDITLDFTVNADAHGGGKDIIYSLSAFRGGEFPSFEIILNE